MFMFEKKFYEKDDEQNELIEQREPEDFLGPMNTVADFISELYDSIFRDILGNDIMDRTLGSFSKQDLFRVMSCVFLQDGNQRLYEKLVEGKTEGAS